MYESGLTEKMIMKRIYESTDGVRADIREKMQVLRSKYRMPYQAREI